MNEMWALPELAIWQLRTEASSIDRRPAEKKRQNEMPRPRALSARRNAAWPVLPWRQKMTFLAGGVAIAARCEEALAIFPALLRHGCYQKAGGVARRVSEIGGVSLATTRLLDKRALAAYVLVEAQAVILAAD